MSIVQLKSHPTLLQANEVKMICAPLEKLQITDFIFLRIYQDGSMLDLSTNALWSEFHFEKFYRLEYTEDLIKKHIHIIHDKEIDLWTLSPDNQIWIDAREKFNILNGISIEKKFESHKEIYYFASTGDNSKMNHFYLNNMYLLEKFMLYFKARAENLIKMHEGHLLKTPEIYLNDSKKLSIHSVHEQKIIKFLGEINAPFGKTFVHGDMVLTNREIECALWVSKGKSCAEIGTIIGLSARTVEAHINNIKNKINCYKLPELIYKLSKLNII